MLTPIHRDPTHTVLVELYALLSQLPACLEKVAAAASVEVHQPEIDLSSIVEVVARLELAIANLPKPAKVDNTEIVEAIGELAKKLPKQFSVLGGGTGPSDEILQHIKRGISDYQSRFDYDGRTDEQPVYIGRAPSGVGTTTTDWTIEKVAYDGDNRPTHKQVLQGTWDERTSLEWV